MKVFTLGYEGIKPFISLLFFFLALLLPSSARAEEDKYVDELLRKASVQNLYSDRYWDVLLHYKHHTFGIESLIDDPRFFLSADGKHDPEAELKATIKSFFEEVPQGNAHPRCRFVGRYEWLKGQLQIDESMLPLVKCADFEEAFRKVTPKSAVFVFPASHINSPASMFGHTLLRIDGPHQSRLLSYAINYAALTDESNGLAFAFKGIFGYYKGYYSILPYYEKVREYNDIDQRDMWEYSLNLSEEEVRRMFLHLWELKEIYSYYYFFDENCSYNLLFLLEAARPSVNITDKFGIWVIPVDTIRIVYDAGMALNISYRPSKTTKIRHILSLLDKDAEAAVLQIIDQKTGPEEILQADISQDDKIRILDLASEVIQYRYANEELTKDDYTKQFLKTLSARSTLEKTGNYIYDIAAPPRPEMGHRARRLSIGFGAENDTVFSDIRFRPAYHDLLDPSDGYVEGSQIIFADIDARYYFPEKKLKLQGIDLIKIVSISPRNSFFKPLSWKVSTGLLRKTLSDEKEHLVYNVNPGVGWAFTNRVIGLPYIFLETDLDISGKLDAGYSFGIGASAGFIRDILGPWKVGLSIRGLSYEIGERHKDYEVSFIQNFAINRNNSIRVDLTREDVFKKTSNSAKVSWNLYF